jgi:hypothetical protein
VLEGNVTTEECNELRMEVLTAASHEGRSSAKSVSTNA